MSAVSAKVGPSAESALPCGCVCGSFTGTLLTPELGDLPVAFPALDGVILPVDARRSCDKPLMPYTLWATEFTVSVEFRYLWGASVR